MIQAVLPEDAMLKELVLKYNLHNCVARRCFKHGESSCRFGYPFAENNRDDCFNGRWLYKRGPNDKWIVPYCPPILLMFQGSHSIIRMTNALTTSYLVKYVAKSSPVLDFAINYQTTLMEENEII